MLNWPLAGASMVLDLGSEISGSQIDSCTADTRAKNSPTSEPTESSSTGARQNGKARLSRFRRWHATPLLIHHHRISPAPMCNREDADVTRDDLPKAADRFLPKPEVLRIAGFSAATLGREVKAGRFPGPVAISANRVGIPSRVRSKRGLQLEFGSRTTAPCQADDREARAA